MLNTNNKTTVNHNNYSHIKTFIITAILTLTICSTGNASSTTYYCNYPEYASSDGVHKQKNKFEINFLVNGKNEKSYLLGNNGSSEVAIIDNWDGGITLIEITASGNVMTTVISKNGKSVHSRANSIAGELVPSQHYGSCIAK